MIAASESTASSEDSPLPDTATIPLIRQGVLGSPTTQPLRLENPMELLRGPTANSIFFGLLQSTGTQKALFRKLRHRGGRLVDWLCSFGAAAYNLVRWRNLVAQRA